MGLNRGGEGGVSVNAKTMTEKQRVKHWIHFEQTDCVPWQLNYTGDLARRLMVDFHLDEENHTVLGKNIYRYNRLDSFLGNHIAYVRNRAVNSTTEQTPGIWKDEWGVLWDRRIDRDIGVPVNCILSSGRLDDLPVPTADDPQRYDHFQPTIKANSSRYILAKFTYNLFERAWALRGMENLLIDFAQNPSFVHELMGLICEFNLEVMRRLARYAIDGIYFGDDWGSQRALLMSPEMWRVFIRPYLKRMYDQAHAQGYDVFIHSCGDISVILDDLVDIGLDVFNPFQPEVMYIAETMQRYSGRLAFYGSLSIQKTLPFGTTADVQREVEERISLARQFGGLIISPSHDMPGDISTENVAAMLEALREQ